MKNWLIKTAFNLMGGIDGLVEFAINWFNEKVLQKIKDKDEFSAYAEDCSQFSKFVDGVIMRHSKWMNEEKRNALIATMGAVNELAAALMDCKIDKDEIDKLIDAVKEAIKAWKNAK